MEDTRNFLNARIFIDGPVSFLGLHLFYVLRIKLNEATGPDLSPIIDWVAMITICPVPEIVFAIHPKCFKHGLMTQAIKAFLKNWWDLPRRLNNFKLTADEPEYVHAACERLNIAGLKVLEKCGFRKYGMGQFDGKELILFRIGRVFPHTLTRPTEDTSGN